MTSVSAGQVQQGPLAGGTSSFGQFRLTTFVDSTPKPTQLNATSPASRIIPADEVAGNASTIANDDSMISSSHALMAPSRISQIPAQPGREPPSVPAKPVASLVPVMDSASSAHNGFGVIDLASPAGAEGGGGKLGPHRDGRVRNPVPSKLKGKTDNRNGNFAVMHMDMSGSTGSERLQRGEAAQRTSESTAQAAMSAQKDGYKPLKRIRLEPPSNQSPKLPPPPPPPPTSQQRAADQPPPPPQAPQFIPPNAQREPVRRTRPLTAEETKYEQARLLTLLRSINPLTVVDQICKALAFFGGIPGAPPPQDGRFPESAESNGSGTLFVGWLSEIFPDLERRAWKPEVPASLPVASQTPTQTIPPPNPAPVVHEANRVKRPRGRPKGSKATKVRKDKGIKKGPKFARKGDVGLLHDPSFQHLQPVSGQMNDLDDAEDEWIDVGGSEIQLERSGSPDDNDLESTRNPTGAVDPLRTHENSMDISADDELLNFPHSGHQPLPTTANIGKRRPGRPRGSRNRPKEAEVSNLPPPQPPLSTITNQQHHIASENISAPGSQSKRRPGRPPGSKTPQAPSDSIDRGIDTSRDSIERPVHAHPFASQSSDILGQTISPTPMNGVSVSDLENGTQSAKKATKKSRKDVEAASASMPQLLGLNAEEQAVLEAFRNARAAQAGNQPSADKRKRPRPSSVTQSQDTPTGNTAILPGATVSRPAGSDRMTEAAAHAILVESPQKSSPVPTPNKRQRKAKNPEGSIMRKKPESIASETASTPMSRNVISNNSTFPVTTVTTEAAMPAPRAVVQGLEAHYEHFAHLQQQQEQQQQQQQPARREQNSVARSSPVQGSPFYQQATTHVTPSYQQQYTSHQGAQQYHSSQPSQSDTFRVINNQQPTTSFSPRQPTSQFTPFPDSSYIDLPALESVANGTAHVGGFGPGVSRSAAQGSFGTGTGIGNGFDGALNENELRERLLRGIGRR